MNRVELLAPAKDKKTAFAAINSGCDALYIGANSFGARQNASNSLSDLREIVKYAHKFNVKVHVAVNTILNDDELVSAQNLIQNLYDIGIDAIIVQDMGILELAINGKLPPIPIHASTQCNNRSLGKVKFFDKLGITRVILARELSLEKIKEICHSTKAEIETFIHGALCVSYSGQCYMSCAIGGRSANRGECAQSCRKKYSLIKGNGEIIAKDLHLLSMKDFNASIYIKDLIDAGVKSFKIEGRLKDENYVKNVVAYYRREIDKYSNKTSSGKVFLDFEPNLNKSFNRGFTDYFLNGRTNCFNFETPKSLGEKLGKIKKVGKDYFEMEQLSTNISSQDGLCFLMENELSGCLVNKIDGQKIFPNKMNGIKSGLTIYRNFDAKFEKQLENSKTRRRIGVKFLFNENILHATDEDGNETAMEVSCFKPAKNPQKMKETFITQLQKTGESDFYTEDIKINGNIPFMPISEINALRRDILEKLMEERLNNYENEVQQPLKHTPYPEKILDYRANVHNQTAKEFYQNCEAQVTEMSFESKPQKCIELMRTKHCLKFAFNMCKSPEKLFLVDDRGKKYPLEFDCKNCEMVIKNN